MDLITKYPNGFANGVAIRGVPILNTYAGNIWWVDSGIGSDGNNGKSAAKPFATIDYAVGRCTASNGDIILVAPGHTESVIAAGGLDLDVAGITIVFLGNGSNRATIDFGTAVTADMDIDAANITLINPRFTASLDALTGPIDVNAANFTINDGEWVDGTGIDTTDCIVADANADTMTIDGWKYIAGDEAGTQKQSNIQIGAATNPVLRNIEIVGDFGTGPIENGTAWVDAILENIVIESENSGPVVGILLQATSTGTARNVHIRVASGTTYVTANNDMQWFECFGTGTDATAGEKIGTQLAGDIEAKVDVIDGYFDVPTKDATTDTTIRDVVGRKTDSAAAGAVSETESLMAYAKQNVTAAIAAAAALVVIDEFHDVPAADNTLNAQINEVIGNKTDAAAAGAVTETDTLVGYIKQLVTAAIAEAAQTLKLDGVTIATAPTAASLASFLASGGTSLGTQLPASKSLYDMVRAYGEGYLVSKAYADLTGYDTAAAFTVTGDVMVKVFGVVGATAITSTSGTTTLSIGTTEAVAGIVAASTIDNTQFAATDVWVDSTPANDVEIMASAAYHIVGGGAAINLVRSVDDITAGTLTLYCFWKPLSSNGAVVAA